MTYYAPYFLQIIRYARLPTNFLGQSTLALVPKGVTVFSIKPSMSFSLSTKSLLFISMILILDIYRYLKYINFLLLENIGQKLRSAHRGETQKFTIAAVLCKNSLSLGLAASKFYIFKLK